MLMLVISLHNRNDKTQRLAFYNIEKQTKGLNKEIRASARDCR